MMNRRNVALLLASVLFGAAAMMPAQPRKRTTVPAGPAPMTKPAVHDEGLGLPEPYLVLLSRSLFARGGMAAPIPGLPGASGGAEAIGPEGGLGLRGVARDSGEFVALIEELGAHRTMQLKPGDAVGQGKITGIDLVSIAYESSAGIKRIEVGQNLLGMPLPPTTQPAAAPGPPGPNGPTGPPGPPGQGPPGTQIAPAMLMDMEKQEAVVKGKRLRR